jgi:hypothetical protein
MLPRNYLLKHFSKFSFSHRFVVSFTDTKDTYFDCRWGRAPCVCTAAAHRFSQRSSDLHASMYRVDRDADGRMVGAPALAINSTVAWHVYAVQWEWDGRMDGCCPLHVGCTPVGFGWEGLEPEQIKSERLFYRHKFYVKKFTSPLQL